MRLMFPAVALLASIGVSTLYLPPVAAQRTDAGRFEIRGTVISSQAGQPVGGALVQIPGLDEAQFSGSDGRFIFSNIPRGQFTVTARKPGFFNEQELGYLNAGMDSSLTTVPSDAKVILRLIPEGVIYGEVKDENGEPMERVTVGAQRWQTADGHRQLQFVGNATTDDLGAFRIAELRPGNYYLSFQVANRGGTTFSKLLPNKKEDDEGYGLQFYPGVSDEADAKLIEIRPGSQIHIPLALSRQRLFEVSGVVHGVNRERSFSLALITSEGAWLQSGLRIDPKTGDFQFQGIPAGTYLIRAMASLRAGAEANAGPPLSATLPIYVNSDIAGLVLTLSPEISIGVQVRDEISNSETASSVRTVVIRTVAKEFARFSPTIVAPRVERDQVTPAKLEGLIPGTYTVLATPNFMPGYVANLRCGNVDLLRDDLTIAPGAAPPPIEVILRDDGAQLDGTVTENGRPASAAIVIYSQDYPKRSQVIQPGNIGSFSADNLPPGRYQVLALKDAGDVEFRNPAAMEIYLSHASAVTLGRRDKATIRLEVQHRDEER